MFDIVEKYITLGGEAPLTGHPVYIVRFTGCNLNCIYCDTKYNNEINFKLTAEELISDILNIKKDYLYLKILFTGGEPLLNDRQEQILKVIKKLKYIDFFIETNGSIKITDFNLANCHYIADWKTPSSGNDDFCLDNLKKYKPGRDCIKIVINKNDFDWTKNTIGLIKKINPKLKIFLSCQWSMLSFKELADFILINKLQAELNIQIHKIIWDDKTRGV